MSSIRISLLLLVLQWSVAGSVSAADGVEWLRSAAEAAELSAKTGKPILIYVRSASCHYCDLMQKNVWQDPKTAAMITRNFIPLKLTKEENQEGVTAMKVKGFPTTLVFSPERSYIGRIDGYVSSEEFLTTVNGFRTAALEKGTALNR